MSVKTSKYGKMFCTLKFVPVLHPNPVTLHILFYFFNSAAILEICKLDTENAISACQHWFLDSDYPNTSNGDQTLFFIT